MLRELVNAARLLGELGHLIRHLIGIGGQAVDHARLLRGPLGERGGVLCDMGNGFERLLRARRQLLRRRRNGLCRAGDIRHDLTQTVLHRIGTVCEYTDLILAGFVQIGEAEIALRNFSQSLSELLNGLQCSADDHIGECAQDENDEDGGDDRDH